MATLRTLRTIFRADTSQFERGTKRARNATRNWRRSTDNLGRSLRRVGGIALGYFGIRGLGQTIANTLRAADETAKWSARLGVTGEQLQILQFHAEKSGVQINQLRLGLQRMTRRVSEAAQGTGEAQAAIKELGLSASDLVKLSPDEQLRRIADAMQQVESQSNRVRLAFKLFDSEGVALVNTMKEGAKGFEDAGKRLRELGGIISDEELKRAEQLRDEFTEIGKAVDRLKTAAVTGILPDPKTINKIARSAERGTFWRDLWLGMSPVQRVGLPPKIPSSFPQQSLTDFSSMLGRPEAFPMDKLPAKRFAEVSPALKKLTDDVNKVRDATREAAGSLAGLFDVAAIRAQGFSAVLDGILSQLLSLGSQAVGKHVLSVLTNGFVQSPFSVDEARARP